MGLPALALRQIGQDRVKEKGIRQLVALCWFGMLGGMGLSIWQEEPEHFVRITLAAIALKGGENMAERVRLGRQIDES